MALAKMKKVRLVIARSDLAGVLCELMFLGCVEISPPDDLLADPELAVMVSRENAETERCRADMSLLEQGIDILNKYAPDGGGRPSLRPAITYDNLLYETDAENCLKLAKLLDTLDSLIITLTEGDKAEYVAQIAANAVHRDELQLCYDHYRIRIALALAVENLLGTEYTLVLSGWIPAASEQALILKLSRYACAWEIADPLFDESDSIPVKLTGPKFLGRLHKDGGKPFEPMTADTKYVDVIRGHDQ